VNERYVVLGIGHVWIVTHKPQHAIIESEEVCAQGGEVFGGLMKQMLEQLKVQEGNEGECVYEYTGTEDVREGRVLVGRVGEAEEHHVTGFRAPSGQGGLDFEPLLDKVYDFELDEDRGTTQSSLPDPEPIETDQERRTREESERAALAAVGDYKREGGVNVEAVPAEMSIKIIKGRYIAHRFETGWEVGMIKGVEGRGKNKGYFSVKYKTDKNLWLHELDVESYGVDKAWVLLDIPKKK